MPHIMKIFLKIILERISHKLGREIGEEQFGFRAGSGTREGIFCMNNSIQKHIQVQKDMYACFIDYSKAFDRIHHIKLIECLERTGIDGKDIRIIGNLYWQQKAAIKVGNDISEYTEIHRGVRQGCVLSPYLFNIYTEFIFRESEDLVGVTIGGRNLNNLRYADDTVLMANNKEDLNNLVQTVQHHSRVAGLEMNAKKTKTMVFSKSTDTPRANLRLENTEIEQVTKFKYLGATITDDGRSEVEIKIRAGIAKERFSQLKELLTSRQISLNLRKKMLNCYIFSIFMYGSEAWTIPKAQEKKINALEMWCLRRMGRISWKEKKTNKEVCEIMKYKPALLNIIKSRKLTYFGHTKRHNNICKEILEGRIEGTRARGRQRALWTDNIREWTSLPLSEATRKATNRDAWRVIARRPLRQR